MGMQAGRLDDVDIRDGGVFVETGGVQCVTCMGGMGRALGVLGHYGIPIVRVEISIVVLVARMDGVHRAAVRVVCVTNETVFGRDCVGVHTHS